MLPGFGDRVDDLSVALTGLNLFDGLELDDARVFVVITFSLQCYENTHRLTDHVSGDLHGDTPHQVGYT